LGLRRRRGRRRGPDAAEPGAPGLGAGGGAVVDGGRVAMRGEMSGHWKAHHTQPDESHSGHQIAPAAHSLVLVTPARTSKLCNQAGIDSLARIFARTRTVRL